MSNPSIALLRARWNVHQATARITFMIYIFGNELAERYAYEADGIEAVALYLSNRDHIPPERTLSYKTDLLNLLLSKEMKGWSLPYTWDQAEAAGPSSPAGSTWRLIQAEAHLEYNIECFGDWLAEGGSLGNLNGAEALRLYLVNKHHWHPADVSALSLKTMGELLAAEMKGWTMTREQVAATEPE